MVNGLEHMKKSAIAARSLMESGHVDAAAGRYSRTLSISVSRRGTPIEACALAAALKQGWSMISLEFGETAKAKRPTSFTVALGDGSGGAWTTHDCALAIHADGHHVLVPRGTTGATFHFAIGPDGLERRHGQPSNLAASTIRASRNMVAAARDATGDHCIEVHGADAAA